MCLLTEHGEAKDLLVYKCQDGDHHLFQSMPCAGAELKRWTARAEVMDTQATERKEAMYLRSQRNSRSRGARSGAARSQSNTSGRTDACAQARQGRERAYAKAGLKRDFAMSSLWDNKVHQACW